MHAVKEPSRNFVLRKHDLKMYCLFLLFFYDSHDNDFVSQENNTYIYGHRAPIS